MGKRQQYTPRWTGIRGKVNGWYVRRGDPAGLTIEESLAYYAYEPVENNRIEHFLGLAQTQNCDVIGFCDERPWRYPHAAGSGHHDDCQRLTFYRGHMPYRRLFKMMFWTPQQRWQGRKSIFNTNRA